MTKTRVWRYPLLMAGLTLFLIWKIHLGLFHDEIQLVDLGKLLVEGATFVQFTGMGMSHYLLWPLMAVYHRIVGSYDGVFLYLRCWFVLIQLLVSIYTYTTCRLFWSEKQATAASCLCMLYVFNFYSITYKAALFWCTMLTVLFLLRWEKTRKTRYLVLSALALSADVLGYPPIPVLLIIPVTRLLLRDRASARRTVAVYWGTCALCALAFLLAVLLRYPASQILDAYFAKSIYNNSGFVPAAKKMTVIAGAFLVMEAGVRFAESRGLLAARGRRLWEALSVLLWLALIAVIAVKPRTAQASRFWYVFLAFYLFAVILRRHGLLRIRHGQLVDLLFYEVSAWTVLGIALISDQGIAIVAYGSVFGLIGACMALLDEDNARSGRPQALAGSLLLAMLICAAVFVSDQNITLESSNVFQKREKITEGPGRGLYVTPYTMQCYDSLVHAARGCAGSGDRLFVISDLMQPLGAMSADAVEAIPCGYRMSVFLNTPKGEEYCAVFPDRSPTVVLVDTAFTGDYEAWRETAAFARYLDAHFTRESRSADGRWIVLRRLPGDG